MSISFRQVYTITDKQFGYIKNDYTLVGNFHILYYFLAKAYQNFRNKPRLKPRFIENNIIGFSQKIFSDCIIIDEKKPHPPTAPSPKEKGKG